MCSGHYAGSKNLLQDCKKLDLDSRSPEWKSFVELPENVRDFTLVQYDDYMYAIGGYAY